MPARWEEVLDYQLDLWKLWRSDIGKGYAQSYANSVLREIASEPESLKSPDTLMYKRMHETLAYMQEQMAWLCEPIYVDPDMMTLIEAAAKTFEEEQFHAQDLITDAGFVLLPRPYENNDIHNKMTAERAIAWYPITFNSPNISLSGVAVALYHHVLDNDDYSHADHRRPLGQSYLVLSHFAPYFFGAKRNDTGEELTLVRESHMRNDPRNVFRFIQAMWRIMQQTITVKDQDYAGSKVRSRLKRNDYPEKRVTIIKLRRPRAPLNPDHEVRDVEWHSRWLVSGHWRNQWFPSVGLHRQIWISPYVKGPEDKPLEMRKLRVFELVR